MTARDDFDRHLSAWLDDRAPVREPELLLGQVLARTARTRRRPAWLIPERWIPMSSISTRLAPTSRVPWRPVALVALLIVALIVGAIVISGSRQPKLPPPFGLAANGTIAYSTNGDILVADSPLGEPRVIVGGATNDNGPLYSPNGTRIAFVRGTIGAADAQLWAALADGSGARMLTDASTVGWVELVAAVRHACRPTRRRTQHHLPRRRGYGSCHADGDRPAPIWRASSGARPTGHSSHSEPGTTPASGGSTSWTGRARNDPSPRPGPRIRERHGLPGEQATSTSRVPPGPPTGRGCSITRWSPRPARRQVPDSEFMWRPSTRRARSRVTVWSISTPPTDDEFAGSWLGAGDDILFQTVEGTENRLVVGSVAASHGPGRDLGVSAQDWFSIGRLAGRRSRCS